jgi:hypothetical protein
MTAKGATGFAVLASAVLAGLLYAHVGAGIAVDGEGRVFFIDNARNTLWRMEPDGALTAVARDVHGDGLTIRPNGTLVYPRDEPASVFSVTGPDSATYRAAGHRILRTAADGSVAVVAGDSSPGFADGPGSGARFRRPLRLSLDSAGNIYVADYGNHRVRKIAPNGVVSTVALVSWPWWPTGVAVWRDRIYVLERWGDYYRMPPVPEYLANLIGQPRISVLNGDGTTRVVARVVSWPARVITAAAVLGLIALVGWRVRRALRRLRAPG